ncbi:PAS domain-containing protein [Pseudazoarcus pumilus]|uniref:Histidine kinase n=1 Tax=Pseudazoarcus pumilus TaxID=2067960 RepID=A0A2I6S3D4_9RHOO|nr:PAS domain S-box protein [Pseudazoarcus pumilus]AUN93780.1 histidine kinase [Pseudazoarcus pumilus]
MSLDLDFRQLADTAGDAIVVSDVDGVITYWNAAATRIFGFAQDDAIGASLDIIIPERLRARHWEGYHKTMATGQTRYGTDVLRVPALNASGETLSIAFTVSLLSDREGRPQAIVAIIRDESERFREERALRARLADLERSAADAAAS